MILSPEAATRVIGAIIAPAVMISACAILLNGIILRYTAIDNLLRSLKQESVNLRQSNLGNGPKVNQLHHLECLTPKLLHHHHLLHNILALIYFSLFIFVVDMLVVAVSIATSIQWVSYLVLAIFLVAVCILCWSLFLAFYELQASHNFIQFELQMTCDWCNPRQSKK
ncbi:MAG: DUF2721 domain-containing protein [Myxacorys californica WJT36-NPBG1]|jgi:hypothetical protein|nr:DUF2721 domain-containing protein [Myxacorys californica WJT36-NPBG1]